MQVRILPFVIFACVVLMGIKVADVIQGTDLFTNTFLIGKVNAESSEEEKPKEEAKEGEGKKEEKKKEKEKEKKEEPAIKVSETPPANALKASPEVTFSQSEVEVLQRLRQRREQLEGRDKELETREKVLRLTESRIDQKVEDLKSLKAEVQNLLDQYNHKEEVKLQSLVKIYENMKPKDAARIFEELDMGTLLPVVAKMKEANTAPVLAAMDPKKAKEITSALANMRRLPGDETGEKKDTKTK